MLAGADGVISVAANVAPQAFRALCDAALARDAETAQRIDGSLAALYELLGVEPNPIPLKWCLHRLGFGEPDLRLPLLPLSPAQRERADRVVASLPGMNALYSCRFTCPWQAAALQQGFSQRKRFRRCGDQGLRACRARR